MTKTI